MSDIDTDSEQPSDETGGLKFEQLIFTPRSGRFDADRVMGEAEKTGFAFRDEFRTSMVVVAASEEVRELFRTLRREDPDDGFPYTMLIDVGADRMRVTPPYGPELEAVWLGFIRWLMSLTPCTVTNEFETDLTQDVTRLCAAA